MSQGGLGLGSSFGHLFFRQSAFGSLRSKPCRRWEASRQPRCQIFFHELQGLPFGEYQLAGIALSNCE